jgi:hypothetical protein
MCRGLSLDQLHYQGYIKKTMISKLNQLYIAFRLVLLLIHYNRNVIDEHLKLQNRADKVLIYKSNHETIGS